MKKLALILTSIAMTGSASAVFVLVPNGDFSAAAGEDWNQSASGGTVITYETTGGNSGGFGKIDANGGTWGGVLVSEGGTGANPAGGSGIPLGVLGLTAGSTYTFSWDQIDLQSPANGAVAGIKIESWLAGALISDSGDQLTATNASWTGETFSYTIAPTADAVKVVMVQNQGAAGGGTTGFDNIGVENNIPEPTSALMIALGGAAFMLRRRRS